MRHIYFDNAASTPIWPEVLEVMCDALKRYQGNPSSIHYHGRQARADIERARKVIAHLFNVSVGEIFFTSGGTEAANLCISGAVKNLGIKHIITSPIEHPCILQAVQRQQASADVEVSYLDVDVTGRVRPDSLLDLLSDKNTLVSIMHANNEIGTVNDIPNLRSLCASDAVYFQSDTVQTVGHFPMDWTAWDIDFASASAHKFHGPKGIGFVYINQRNKIPPLILGGSQERNMRAGTENVASIVGMAKALELCHQRMDSMKDKVQRLKSYLIHKLSDNFADVRFRGDLSGPSLYTVLSVAFPSGNRSAMLVQSLDIEGISVSGGSACSSGAQKQSQVLATIAPDDPSTTIRISFNPQNTREEVDTLVEKLQLILQN